MKTLMILLLLVACTPIAAVPSPASEVQSPTTQIPTQTSTLTAITPQPTPPATTQPSVTPLLNSVSEARLRADLLSLQNFHTRHSASTINTPNEGIGAARAWLIAQFKSISPRLQVETDDFVFTFGNRPVPAQNIIATLPGTITPVRIIIISAHYDSRTLDISDSRSAAPGANDDGSGVVAVLELARALSTQQLDATLMFILFAGEEEGLYGSTHLAPVMRKNGANIIAMLNNDIIGNTIIGSASGTDGMRVDNHLRVFSGDPDDGPSRQLAREAKRIAEREVPDLSIDLVPALDRVGRGGDQMPFYYAGFPAIRFTEAVENLQHQHNGNDRVEFMDIVYLAKVVRVNLAVALQLASAGREK